MAHVNLKVDSVEELLKKLAYTLGERNEDVAQKVYKAMRSFLLDFKHSGGGSSCSFDHVRDNSQENTFAFQSRQVKQYLDTENPTTAKQFVELCEKLRSDKTLPSSSCFAPLTFLMVMGRRKSLDESILESIYSPTRIKISKGRAPLPPVDDGLSSIYTDISQTRPSVSALKAQFQLNGSSMINKDAKFKESILKCSRVTEQNLNLDVGGDLSEWDVIEGLLFVWQGIPSKIFRRCEATQNYFLHEKWKVYPWIREKADNLAVLGYLHDCLLQFAETPTDSGLIRKCLSGFIRDQLSDYYTLIASIRTEFQRQVLRDENNLTLEKLRIQSTFVARKFMDLLSILELTKDDRGGYLASGVFCFIRHGDPDLQNLVKAILAEICKPLYAMLTKWLLEGNLNDPSKEFFIAADSIIGAERLWNEKYKIRTSMLPEFIPVSLADKILSVGRSINFLRELCDHEQPYAERDKIKSLYQSHSVEVMYLTEQSTELERLVDKAYEETNKTVLQVLLNKYALLDHFQGHRKYLLLGQGEFIHHLMDLLMTTLEKPVDQLHPHVLNSTLESAIRATSTQFEPDYILGRLSAATLVHADGETGWEVFCLQYSVDEPLFTVFSAQTRLNYQKLFCALWKAKRMEMVLSKSWKRQIITAKSLRKIGELGPVLRQCHELTAEMLHFVRQTQYYFLFEVLECAWNQLIKDINQAHNLDAVIAAHSEFLEKVEAGVFIDTKHQGLARQLRVVNELVLALVRQVDEVLVKGEREAVERAQVGAAAVAALEGGEGSRVDYFKQRREFVNKVLPDAAGGLRVLGKSYRGNVRKFIMALNSENDENLHLLSFRLDFNSHYNQLDSRLEAPLTFQHRRMSSLGGDISPLLTRKFSGRRLSGKAVV